MNHDEELAALYDNFADWKLLEMASASVDLTDQAQALLHAEFRRRGMSWPEKAPETADNAAKRYAAMSNAGLLETAQNYAALTQEQKNPLRAEFESRGLEPPIIREGKVAQDAPAQTHTPEGKWEAGNFVTVRTYRDLPEAIVARSVLEQAEIVCRLLDEHTVGIHWDYSNFIGGLRLQVLESDLAEAQQILSQPIPQSIETDAGEYHQPVCPKCGSLDVSADDLDRKIKLASTTLSGLPMTVGLPALAFVNKGAWKCLQCGSRWVDDAEQAIEESTQGR